jgi:hypothetical protein
MVSKDPYTKEPCIYLWRTVKPRNLWRKQNHSKPTSLPLSFFFVIHGFGVSRFFFVGYIDIVTSREKKRRGNSETRKRRYLFP